MQVWRHTPLIPELGKQRLVDLYEFEASLVYRESSRAARTTQRNPVSRKQNRHTVRPCFETKTNNPRIKGIRFPP